SPAHGRAGVDRRPSRSDCAQTPRARPSLRPRLRARRSRHCRRRLRRRFHRPRPRRVRRNRRLRLRRRLLRNRHRHRRRQPNRRQTVASTKGVNCKFLLSSPGDPWNEQLGFWYEMNVLYLFTLHAGVETDAAVLTWSATDDAWLRIRESAGTIFWETSADGA